MVFQGENMDCVMCGRKQKSDPSTESNWTYIKVDGQGFYCCPHCLQWSNDARKGRYDKAYKRVLNRILNERMGNNVMDKRLELAALEAEYAELLTEEPAFYEDEDGSWFGEMDAWKVKLGELYQRIEALKREIGLP